MKRNLVYIVFLLLLVNSFSGVENIFAQTSPDTIANKDTTVISPDPITADSVEKFFEDTLAATAPATATATATAPSPPKPPEAHSVISMEFIKDKIEHSPDSTYFNILKITNNNASAVQGVVNVSVPLGWKLISEEETIINIFPGNTEYIPIRVSLARTASGGVSYLINATLNSNRSLFTDKNQTSITKSCYVTIPKNRRWDVLPVQRTVYVDRYSAYSQLKLKMTNKGNGAEVVKLEFEIGSSLSMFGALGNKHFTSIELKPHSDTIISYPIKYIPVDESDLWNRDFKKLTVRITATVDTIIKKTSVNFKYLESAYHNILFDKLTPLNIELQLQNLLSDASPRMLASAYGTILLKNDDVIDYDVRFMSIAFAGYKGDFGDNLWTRSRMMAGYRSQRWEAKIGDNVGYAGSGILSAGGRGIGGKYKINNNNTIGGSFSAAVTVPMYSAAVFHETMLLKRISLNSTLNAILDDYNKMNTYGASVQSNFSLLPGHNIFLLLAGSTTQHNYDNQTFLDPIGNFILTNDPGVTRYGFASHLGYRLHIKKVTGGLNLQWATKDFSQYNSGKLNINANAQYQLSNKYYLTGSSGVFMQDPRRYNRGILFPQSKYLSGMHRVEMAGRMTKKLTLFTGPVLEHLSYTALKTDFTTGDSIYARFSTISPKLSVRCSYKNHISGFVNPYAMFGYTFITSAEDSSINIPTPFLPKDAFFNLKAGLNVIQRNWGMNVYYYFGPQSLTAQTDYYYFGRYSKSIRILPFYQKYYFNKTMLLSSYNSYYYEVSSNNERIALNARVKFFLGNYWTLYVDNNIYLSSIINSEGQKAYSRSYFLNLGVTKSFDIPQPRIKYYDLKVICYKDINGNQTMDDNEHGLSDIVISIDRRMQADSVTGKPLNQRGQFAPAEMVTDNFGQIIYYHIPEGEFEVRVFPLVNLVDLYNINGQTQKVNVSRDTTYYIPFVQSYRVTGKVIVNRDEYSSAGSVSLGSIRITATDSLGNSFPTLTNPDGSYTLYAPKAGEYKVTINNILPDPFILQEAEYKVSFDGAKEFNVDFIYSEKKRKININGTPTSADSLLNRKPADFIVVGNDTIKNVTMVTDTMTNTSDTTRKPVDFIVVGNDTIKNVTMVTDARASNVQGQPQKQTYLIPVGKGISYKIQLVATKTRIPQSKRASIFTGISVTEYSENEVYKYVSGSYTAVDDALKAKTTLRSKGYSDAFLVPFFKGKRLQY